MTEQERFNYLLDEIDNAIDRIEQDDEQSPLSAEDLREIRSLLVKGRKA